MLFQKNLLLACAYCALWFSCTPTETVQCPKASFSLIQDTCIAPCSPGLLNTSTAADTYVWSLYDGDAYSAFEPGQIFTERGIYTISLRAYNSICEDSAEFRLVVLDAAGLLSACDTMDCGKHGTCYEGICQCETGWEGPFCDQAYAAKLVGTYQQVDSCGNEVISWPQAVVIRQLAENLITLQHFGNLPTLAAMVVKENSTDVVARKIVFDQKWESGQRLLGSGIMVDKTIHGQFTRIEKDGSTQSCSFVLLGN